MDQGKRYMRERQIGVSLHFLSKTTPNATRFIKVAFLRAM
jgi:hypothetical protein